MADNLKKLTDLKQKVETLKAKLQRARGAYEQLSKELLNERECDTLTEARTLLRRMQKKQQTLKGDYDTKLKEFEDEWSEELERAEKS